MRRGRGGRREILDSGLSFLDVISCGFGAVILLLIITKTVEPVVLEKSTDDLEALLIKLQEELFDIRGDTREVRRELTDKRRQLEEALDRVAVLERSFSRITADFDTTRQRADTLETELSQFADARQTLSEEMQRLLGNEFRPQNELAGGIPVDSEYIIFVIDTSGSMFQNAWTSVADKMEEALDLYPEVKGIQVMNDQGTYMFSAYEGRWIPDTPARRGQILQRLKGWNAFSNSSPVEGITTAISTYWAPDRKISIYVFGDDFQGGSVEAVIDTVDRINRADEDGNRRVRIHTVGFPVLLGAPRNLQGSANRFATLMRELARRNGGTFVGLEAAQ
ncbi:MAG: VWA domain-containing protein [Pseudomonadota bacterium]|nr:VWA domain-containing protein [Pseudomonadota bacterium]